VKISDACRPHGISEQTYYRWHNKYGGMECFPSQWHRIIDRSEIEQQDDFQEPVITLGVTDRKCRNL
jgi:hypothetical protein